MIDETHYHLEIYSIHQVYTLVVIEMPRDLDRVLTQQLDHYPWVRAWGFRERGRQEPEQVEARLVRVQKNVAIRG